LGWQHATSEARDGQSSARATPYCRTAARNPATIHLDVGAQFDLSGDLVLSVLVGPALRRTRQEIAGYLGVTWVI
jgi:hypothetical protein